MTYTRGTQAAREAVERERAEAERLYAEGRKLNQTVKQLRERNANIEARVAEERDRLEDKRATLAEALADLDQAQADAEAAIKAATENAALIRELAYDQARALAERAYVDGFERGRDRARAKHAVLRRYAPRKPKLAKVIDLTPGELTATPLEGAEGLLAATAEYFHHNQGKAVA